MVRAARLNRTGTLSKLLLPKPHEQPEGHPFILEDGEWRRAMTIEEVREGTKQFHSNWMNRTPSKREIHYLDLETDGVGICGVSSHPDRPFTDKDLVELLPEGVPEKMMPQVRQDFIDAHDGSIGQLFRTPKTINGAYLWPVYVDVATGEIVDNGYEDYFYKSLEGVPGKARHENFHLAVVGRMTPKWRLALMRITRLMLLTRALPKCIKQCSRLPIPKPMKVGETRPIALMHDINSMLTGCISKWLGKADAIVGDDATGVSSVQARKRMR